MAPNNAAFQNKQYCILKKGSALALYVLISTKSHTHIYIYIYIERKWKPEQYTTGPNPK